MLKSILLSLVSLSLELQKFKMIKSKMSDNLKERLKSYVKSKRINIDEEKINKMVDFANR